MKRSLLIVHFLHETNAAWKHFICMNLGINYTVVCNFKLTRLIKANFMVNKTFSMEVRQLYTWKLLSSCLKLSTYSFVYRECGLLQNEKVREQSSVTHTPILPLCTLPKWIGGQSGSGCVWISILLEDLEILYFIHAYVSFFFSQWIISSTWGKRI